MFFGIYFVGIGGVGCWVIEEFLSMVLENLFDKFGLRFIVFVIDVGDDDFFKVCIFVIRFLEECIQVEMVVFDMVLLEELQEVVGKYVDFFKFEYFMYYLNFGLILWLFLGKLIWVEDGLMIWVGLKVLYGQVYYDVDRLMQKVLKWFVVSVEKIGGNLIVCIVFGLVGGIGSGIVMDLVCYFFLVQFGCWVFVMGFGIVLYFDEVIFDKLMWLYVVFFELDVFCDEIKNVGIMFLCGDLFKNLFIVGFMIIFQFVNVSVLEVWEEVSKWFVKFIFECCGVNVWEVFRLFNWVVVFFM